MGHMYRRALSPHTCTAESGSGESHLLRENMKKSIITHNYSKLPTRRVLVFPDTGIHIQEKPSSILIDQSYFILNLRCAI